ncbi:hypothetical protein TI05_04130 [Achromatium sp. WMS3]|nr:hypothetical protein TI05_04130 [Achromatium sp. WMS3]
MADKIHNTLLLLFIIALATVSPVALSATQITANTFSLVTIGQYILFAAIVVTIIKLFVRSTYRLLTHGEVLIIPNLFQPFLFGLLYFLIYELFGPEHYHFTSPPQLWDWIQFTRAHILRAGDILDVIEEYKIDIQNVTHGSNFVATIIMAMHWMVDIFLLGALWSLTKSWWEWLQDEYVQALVYITITITMFLLLVTVFVQTAIRSASILAFFINIPWSLYQGLLMWPLDNIIRVIDVGDSFQLYQIRLHSITINWWTSSLAVVFRLLISVPLAKLLNLCHLKCFKGIGKSIPELIADLANDHTRDGVIQRLVRLGKPAIPDLVKTLADRDSDVCNAAAKALGQIDPQWQQSEGAKIAITDLIKKLANKSWWFVRALAAKALGNIGEPAKVAIPDLVKALADRHSNVRAAAAKALGQIGVPAKVAIPDLVKALADRHSNVRAAAAEALDQIDPQWQQSEGAKIAITDLIKKLANKSWWFVRALAAKALGNIGEPAKVAIPDLVKALADRHSNVRAAAADALDKIDPQWRQKYQ